MVIRKKKISAKPKAESKPKSKMSKVKAKVRAKIGPIVQKIVSRVRKSKPLMVIAKAKTVTKPSARLTSRAARAIKAASRVEKEIAKVSPEEKTAAPYVRPFPTGAMAQERPSEEKELPSGYGETKIVLLVRDPWWVHAYWEVAEDKKGELKHKIGLPWGEIRKCLRVYDVTGIKFDGLNANRFFDVEINDFANNWYVNVGQPDRSWCIDLGAKDQSGKFYLIARSNCVTTPRDTVSSITDEEWMLAEDEFRKMYALSGGFRVGVTSPVGVKKEKIREMMRLEFASGGLMSPVKVKAGAKPFWLVVDTELIVYGATEPDAKVTVQGRPIQLKKDGTFSLRFALPDGKQIIPVRAVSADEKDERTITPIVAKETK